MPIARSTSVDSLGVINLIGANLIDRYPPASILKELVQNADDADAHNVVVGWTPGLTGEPKHELLRGPALFVINDGEFKAEDATAICRFGQNYKFGEKAVIGKFGLGLKSVFHLCEAFFYVSSTKSVEEDAEGDFNNLASPWKGTEYQRGWDQVNADDLCRLRKFLEPIWRSYPNWFALWLPLRQRKYCEQVRFSGRFDGDGPGCPGELADALALRGLARAIPLLNSVKSVRVWHHWEASDLPPSAVATLDDKGARSHFRECVATNENHRGGPDRGRYETIQSSRITSTEYVIVESWCSELLTLTHESGWPKSFVLGSGQQPDKAQPHAALVLGRRSEHNGGDLDVATAVFLPLEGPREGPVSDHQEAEFLLTLHGCFFVDSGRRHALHTGIDVRGRWNQRLWNEGVFPLIVPAVAEMARTMEDDPAAVRRLTQCVAMAKRDRMDEQPIYARNRSAVCQAGDWLYRWRPSGARWELVPRSVEVSLLEIPDFGPDPTLPGRTMARLSGLSERAALTPSRWPRLTADDPLPWSDELLGSVLTIDDPRSLFDEGAAGLVYFSRFLSECTPSGPAALTALAWTLRRTFQSVGSRTLRNQVETLQRIVRHLPQGRRLGLPLPANWPDEVRQRVCGAEGGVLIVPEELEPVEARGIGRLTADEAVALLDVISPSVARTRNSVPARAVVQATTDRASVIDRTSHRPLWLVDRVSADGVVPETVSLADLRTAHESRLAVAGRPTDEVRELAAALAGRTVLALSPELAVELFSDPGLPPCNLRGILAALEVAPPLATPTARAPLLRRLLAHRPPPDVNGGWRWGVRYLLHGIADLPAGTGLYLDGATSGVWARLTRTALDAVGESSRVLPSSVLTELLNDQNLVDLGICRLDPDGVGRLLTEVGPERIEMGFTPSERDEVLQGLRHHPAVIRGLPLHDAADGSEMFRILEENCFWVSARFTPGESLRRRVRLLRPSRDRILAAIQRTAYEREFNEYAAIEFILRLDRADHWQYWPELLSALRSAGTLTRGLSDGLAAAVWLPRMEGEPVAPRDVLHDDAFGDEAASALRRVCPPAGDPVPAASLAHEIRNHPGFPELARQLFPDRKRALGRLAGALVRDDRFRIGNLDLRSLDQLNDWLVAFKGAPDEVMAVCELVGSVFAADQDLCVSHLLPSLREGDVPQARLEQILCFLKARHTREQGLARQQTLRVHNAYLRLAAVDRATFQQSLRRLQLMNQLGGWADPAELCAGATGLDPAQSLHPDQDAILRGAVACQPTRVRNVPPESGPRAVGYHLLVAWHESAGELREYFGPWRQADDQVAEWVGAFVAILGDFDPVRRLATDCLRSRMSPEAVRANTGIGSRDRFDPNGRRVHENRDEMMRRQRFFVEVTEVRATIEARNLMDIVFPARPLHRAEDLLIGYGIQRADLFLEGDLQVHHINLRGIEVRAADPVDLRRMIAATADRILREVYDQPNASLTPVLEELSEGQSSDVRVAQAEILDAAGHYLRQFGVGQNQALGAALTEYGAAAYRRAEEQVARERGQQLDGEPADILARRAQDRLRRLLETDPAARDAVLAGVRHKLTVNGYRMQSVLFELFQNADDAYAELGSEVGRGFVVQASHDEITVMHDGRRINHPGPAGLGTAGHTRDLQKMLSLGHSDKGFGPTARDVTGRFGLGFKSVFLMTDRPSVVSGRLAFEVLGAVYPKPLGQEEAESLRARLIAAGLPPATGTAFSIPLRAEADSAVVTDRFRQLAPVLAVFARRIRTIRYLVGQDVVEEITWAETIENSLANAGAARAFTGPLRLLGEAGGTRRAIVVRTPAGDVLFGLSANGLVRIHRDVPTVWVTAPTVECYDLGFLVNAAFALDVGRAQVDWGAQTTRGVGEELARHLGDALVGLFDVTAGDGWPILATALRLAPATGRSEFWQSLWDVVASQGVAPAILRQLFWNSGGGAVRLYSERDSLPTGLVANGYGGLTSLGRVRFTLQGILDQPERESLQVEVAKWSGFRSYQSGSVVSNRLVWSVFRTLVPDWGPDPEPIDLPSVLARELGSNAEVDGRQAERLGLAVNPTLLREVAEESAARRDEVDRIRATLKAAQFRTRLGTWAAAGDLLLFRATNLPDRQDEVLRAGFAPPNVLLGDEYPDAGVAFFYVCRGEMSADPARLAVWAITADTRERRRAVVIYLLRGEHRRDLSERLRRATATPWLGSLPQSNLLSDFNAHDRLMILLSLGLYTPPPTLPPPPPPRQADPAECLQVVAEWWRSCSRGRLAAFDAELYPSAHPPRLTPGGPGRDPAARREWLTLFIAGILATAGRTRPGQIREFLRLCSEQGWLDQLTDPRDGPARWLATIQEYIDRQTDTIPRYHRLRQFVGIATVARYLGQYAQGFLEMDRIDGQFSLRDILTQRTCQHFQGTDLDAPPLGPILGYGACVVVRELARTRTIASNRAYRYCYPPAHVLRRFLTSIGWVDRERPTATPWSRSRSIYSFLREHIDHCPDPTFGQAFDIPLLLLAEDEPLARAVLGDAYPSI